MYLTILLFSYLLDSNQLFAYYLVYYLAILTIIALLLLVTFDLLGYYICI